MRKLSLAFLLVFGLPIAAMAQIPGPVTVIYASPGSAGDTRQCTFFQINNAKPWYAVPLSDAGYESEMIILRDSFEFTKPISFEVGPAVCGVITAVNLFIGTMAPIPPG